MAELPRRATTALELLTNDRDRIEPFLNTIWGPLLGLSSGLLFGCGLNLAQRRPLFSGIQKHIGLMAGLGVAFTFVDKWRRETYAEKDAVLRHYVQLHPDDFILPERKKYSEIIEPWIPIR